MWPCYGADDAGRVGRLASPQLSRVEIEYHTATAQIGRKYRLGPQAEPIAQAGVRGRVDRIQKPLNFTFDKRRRFPFGPRKSLGLDFPGGASNSRKKFKRIGYRLGWFQERWIIPTRTATLQIRDLSSFLESRSKGER
jgi:hypothetical protein